MPPSAIVEPENYDQPMPDTDPDSADNALAAVGDITQLADPKYRDWTWWIYRIRSQEEMEKAPRAKSRIIVTKVVGPLDVIEIQSRYGGGVFEFWGFLDGTLRAKAIHELEGPRKVHDPAASPVVATTSTGNNNPSTDAAMLRIELAQLAKTVEALANKKPEAPQGVTVKDVLELMLSLDKMRGPAQVGPVTSDGALVKEMVGMFREGMDLRREADGGGEQSTLGIVLEKLGPVLERVAEKVISQRRGSPRPAPRQAPRETEATVVELATEAPPSTPPVTHRWQTAVEAMANAIAEEHEPGEFAYLLDGILNSQEIAVLKLASVDQVFAEIGPLVETYPVLKSDTARVFIDAVLSELRNPTEDGSQPS